MIYKIIVLLDLKNGDVSANYEIFMKELIRDK